MVEKIQTSTFPWRAALLGVPLLALWLTACSAAFVFVLNTFGHSEVVLQSAAWPLTLLALGMPIIVAFMFGGARILAQMLQMKSFFEEKLPSVIQDLERVALAIDRAAKSADAASVSAQVAASSADTARAEAASSTEANKELVQRFFEHYEHAKEKFLTAMNKLNRWSEFPRYLQNDREGAIAALREKGIIDQATADYIVAAIDTERNTRRWSRTNLDLPQVDKLEDLAKRAHIRVDAKAPA